MRWKRGLDPRSRLCLAGGQGGVLPSAQREAIYRVAFPPKAVFLHVKTNARAMGFVHFRQQIPSEAKCDTSHVTSHCAQTQFVLRRLHHWGCLTILPLLLYMYQTRYSIHQKVSLWLGVEPSFPAPLTLTLRLQDDRRVY
jgi:hypothetical protein